MRIFRRWTFFALRSTLVLALFLHSITSIAMLFNMTSAQAAPASVGFIVICTPEGLKKIAWSGGDDQNPQNPQNPQSRHPCICACGVLCSTCNVALPDGQSAPVFYAYYSNLTSSYWQYLYDAPRAPQEINVGYPRAPPA